MAEASDHETRHNLGAVLILPSWQQQLCPSWRVEVHQETGFPEDRKHQSSIIAAPAVWLNQDPSDDAYELAAGDLRLLT